MLDSIFLLDPLSGLPKEKYEGTHLDPVAQTVKEMGLAAGFIFPTTDLATEPEDVRNKHRLYIIGDDSVPSDGPSAFQHETVAWVLLDACCVILHLEAGEARHYAFASIISLLHKKVVLVESQPERGDEWKSFIERHAPNAHTLLIAAGK
jgi:hypothetical protein